MTEQQVITAAYYLSEKGNDPWTTSSDEYILARNLANAAINRWEIYDQTEWKDLFTTLAAAATGDKTITASDWDYDCPTDMRYPASYVRTVSSGTSSFWQVVHPAKSKLYANSSAHVCWFTGDIVGGFDLHFNPNVPLTTGDTIAYEYYKQASTFSTTSSTTEMQDPYFIVYFIVAHLADVGVDPDYNNMAEVRLEQMRTKNMGQIMNVSDDLSQTLDNNDPFGA